MMTRSLRNRAALALALALAPVAAGAQPAAKPAGKAAASPATSPALVDAYSLSSIVSADLPQSSSLLTPYGVAVKRDGTVVVAAGMAVLAMDRRWQVTGLPAKKLSSEGNWNFGYSMSMTKADTIYLRSTDGSGMWAFADGSYDYRRVLAEGQAGVTFGVLDDGSPFVVESQAVRVYRRGVERRIDLPEGMSTMAGCAGPDDTIWVADMASGTVLVFSSEGAVLRSFRLDLGPGVLAMRLRLQDDGTLLVATSKDVRRMDAYGRTLWAWDGKDEGLSVAFSYLMDIAAAPGGIIYVTDLMGKRVLRLAERPDELEPDLARVMAASRALRATPDDPSRSLALADAYAAMGSAEAARAALERYLDERPADAKARERLRGLDAVLLKAKAKAAGADALDLMARFGAETAREAYGRAMRVYESLRGAGSDDEESRAAMASLRSAFLAAERGAAASGPEPTIVSAELPPLFPALIRSYRERPAGAIVVRNALAEPMRGLRADLFIRKYMDFPSEGRPVATLAPGKEASLDLFALLNESALEVLEDIPVQAMVTLRWTDSRGERSMELSRPVTLYRRTAITWDDTGKLAAFVTPNDERVTEAAFAFAGRDGGPALVSDAVSRAARVCDALGALPLSYVRDPESPIGEVLGQAASVDTVRLPRTTLAYKGGDCDDTTALAASLLEALGVRTALLTSPGHVFMAFDTGEPEDAAWLFAGPGLRTLRRGGTLWIPLETTTLPEGFMASWKAASDLVARYGASDDFECLELSRLRAVYPPLPLSASTLPVPAPDPARLSAITARDAAAVASSLYEPVRKAVEAERAGASGPAWSRATNRLAELHFRFGKQDLATAALTELAKRDPAFLPAWLNLARLSLLAGRRDEALACLRRAAALAPQSTLVGDFAAALGLGGELGFGPALVDSPSGASDRAAAQAGPDWAK